MRRSYDASGRRISKTIAGVSTGFLYDMNNVVQELYGSTPMANLPQVTLTKSLHEPELAPRISLPTVLGSTLAYHGHIWEPGDRIHV